ncbi:MAG: hypothetical protein R3D59_02160 [Paracoccaceae bacterium]
MIEATTDPALRAAALEAHRARSLLAWRMIAALRALPLRLVSGHEKRAARRDGPCVSAAVSARCSA